MTMRKPAPILVERLSRILQNDAHAGGLKPTQWEALRYLARANRFSRSPGALTAYLGMTKGTVSQTLQALGRKGLIEKTTVGSDRRSVNLSLTKAGLALLAHDPMHGLETVIGSLPAETDRTLGIALEGILKAMLLRRGGRPFSACKRCVHFRRRHDRGAPHYCDLLDEPLSVDDIEKICAEQEVAA